jgi:hypothetical protein
MTVKHMVDEISGLFVGVDLSADVSWELLCFSDHFLDYMYCRPARVLHYMAVQSLNSLLFCPAILHILYLRQHLMYMYSI